MMFNRVVRLSTQRNSSAAAAATSPALKYAQSTAPISWSINVVIVVLWLYFSASVLRTFASLVTTIFRELPIYLKMNYLRALQVNLHLFIFLLEKDVFKIFIIHNVIYFLSRTQSKAIGRR